MGSPASWSQNRVWRYSSSATVASAIAGIVRGAMALPLKPPVLPQLARSASALPLGAGWAYERKWDGFRTIAFVDGDDIHLQSRNGKPMNRYFPDVVAAVPEGAYVVDG